jgi:phage terminase small subunit
MPVLKNAKHERFAQALAEGKTADEAYQLAGYEENRGNASRLKSNESIQKRVSEILGQAAKKVGVTAERVIEELSKIGFSNMLDYVRVNSDGDPVINLTEMTRETAAAVQEITINTRTERGGEEKPDAEVKSVRFKLGDKRAALVDIGKHLGMFKDRVEHSGPDGGPIETTDINQRDLARAVLGILREAKVEKTK